jgi:hypothetical protein
VLRNEKKTAVVSFKNRRSYSQHRKGGQSSSSFLKSVRSPAPRAHCSGDGRPRRKETARWIGNLITICLANATADSDESKSTKSQKVEKSGGTPRAEPTWGAAGANSNFFLQPSNNNKSGVVTRVLRFSAAKNCFGRYRC